MTKGAKVKHEPYLGTQNKRPGPALGDSESFKEEMNERENFKLVEKYKWKFNLTSNRMNLELIEWGWLVSVYAIKNDANKLFFIS